MIARQSDCQTCFMCEAYCPTDALYVHPQSTPLETADVIEDDHIGATERRSDGAKGGHLGP